MGRRQRFLALVGAAALVVTSSLTGLGRSPVSTTFSVTVVRGEPLAASLSAHGSRMRGVGDGLAIPDRQDIVGERLVLSVRDERGIVTGWTIELATRDFTRSSGHIGADALTVSTEPIDVQAGNPDLSGHSTLAEVRGSTASAPLWRADPGYGDGYYALPLASTLHLPASGDLGKYTVLLTIQETAP